jgi:hypothetical protein
MGKQSNKIEKRKRRVAYLKRKKPWRRRKSKPRRSRRRLRRQPDQGRVLNFAQTAPRGGFHFLVRVQNLFTEGFLGREFMVNELEMHESIALQTLIENAFHGGARRAHSGEQVVHKNSFTIRGFLVN